MEDQLKDESPWIRGNYGFRSYNCITCGCCTAISFIPHSTGIEQFTFDGRACHIAWHGILEAVMQPWYRKLLAKVKECLS